MSATPSGRPPAPPTATKICVACGEDCAGQPRTRDPRGRYYHRECHERLAAEAARRKAAGSAAAARATHPPTDSPLLEVLPGGRTERAGSVPVADEGPSFLDGLDLAPPALPAPPLTTSRARSRPTLAGAGAAVSVFGDLLAQPWVYLVGPLVAAAAIVGLMAVSPGAGLAASMVVFGVLGLVWVVWFIKDAIEEGYVVVAVLSLFVPLLILYAIFARAGDGRMKNLWAGLLLGNIATFVASIALVASDLPDPSSFGGGAFGTIHSADGDPAFGAGEPDFDRDEYADGYDPETTPRFPTDDPRGAARPPRRAPFSPGG